MLTLPVILFLVNSTLMAYDLEEQEKLDAIKAWWERYGTLCIVVVTLAVAALAGTRGWQWYQNNQAMQAMMYFEALETAVAQAGQDEDAPGRIKAASTTLRNDYPTSGYTPRGVLLAAQALQTTGDTAAAQEQLNWLINHGKDAALLPLAHLRLATLLLEQAEYEQALVHLQNPPAAFEALFADRRGDVLAAQGKRDEARQAWESALAGLQGEPLQQVIRLKLDALGGGA